MADVLVTVSASQGVYGIAQFLPSIRLLSAGKLVYDFAVYVYMRRYEVVRSVSAWER